MKAGLSEYVAEIDRQSEIPNHGSLSGSVLHLSGVMYIGKVGIV